MPIFKDNYFTNDTYELRLERLKILQNYIDDWAGTLSVPESLVEWAKNAYDVWNKTLQKVEEKKKKRSKLFFAAKQKDEAAFKFYLKCKRFLVTKFSDDEQMLKYLEIDQRFPRRRNEKMEVLQSFLDKLRIESEFLDEELVDKLSFLISQADETYQQAHINEQEGMTIQADIYQKDSKNLRALYSWALMHWEADQPYLVQLGFAVKSSRKKEEEEEEIEQDN